MKIAQIGTFDVENFGDLLFPIVLPHYMKDFEIDLFSPNKMKSMPFFDSTPVYAIDELKDRCKSQDYKAIIIGGGDLIRTDAPATSCYEDASHFFRVWALPILLGQVYDIPVMFNAPGVPFSINNSMKSLVKDMMSTVDYISVRDNHAKDILNDCDVDNVMVVPDSILSISQIYTESKLKICREKLSQSLNLPLDEKYIVVQHNCCNIDNQDYVNMVKDNIQKIGNKGYKMILMPIGYVHQDINFLEKVYQENDTNQYLIVDKLTPYEMCAVLSGSCGYIGTSMHGAVVSYAYEKMALCLNTQKYAKITGVLEQISHIEWDVHDIMQLEGIFESEIKKSVDLDDSIIQRIHQHFNVMIDKISTKKQNNGQIDIINELYSLYQLIDDAPDKNFEVANVYWDYGSGYSDEAMEKVPYVKLSEDEYELEFDIPSSVFKIRIDPIESSIICYNELRIEVDNQIIEPILGDVIMVDEKKVILNSDPSIYIECNPLGHVKMYLMAKKMNIDDIQKMCGSMCYQSGLQLQLMEEEVHRKEENMEQMRTEMNQEIVKLEKEYEKITEQVSELNEQVESLNSMNLDLINRLNEKENEIESIRNSVCWKITSPLRWGGDLVYRLMQKTWFTRSVLEAVKILFQKGPAELFRAGKRFISLSLRSKGAGDANRNASSNNKDGYCAYDAFYQDNRSFEGEPDVKMLAFYLPQFHTFPENDEWWGKGFTEWVNVKAADSRFEGHYQPRVPHADTGYYNLEDIEVLHKQAKLAKEHGIYGFCFYYYWFSGKRLMEKPVDMLLEHPEIDLPFCLCWANENWTRAWDGMNKNVLIAQEYSDQDDIQFMKDMKRYIDDGRYIRIHGKPLVMVYNPGQIPDCHKSFNKWREIAREIGIGEIVIWTCQTANNTADLLGITDCIEAEVEFPPHNMWLESLAVRDIDLSGKSAFIYNYQCLVEYLVNKLKNEKNKPTVPIHHSCMMAWDNAARRKDAWFTYYAFSLKSLYRWVLAIANKAREDFDEEERYIFINAWNEWGEGTYLEADEKYGYANINTVAKALYKLPFDDELSVINYSDTSIEKKTFEKGNNSRIAVQVHMFYLDTLDETIENLNKIPYKFDCYVSTDSDEKKTIISTKLKDKCNCNHFVVDVFENRGRDVAPFLCQMKDVYEKYDYLCHIHSKKTKTNDHGNEWRTYIFDHLFGSKEYMKRVFNIFEANKNIGILMPPTYPVLELQAEWGGNKQGVEELLCKMNIFTELPEVPSFPVGNMFWARTTAVKSMFELGLEQKDFPKEAGQVNATIAHQIERSWVYVAKNAGYTARQVFNNCINAVQVNDKKRIGIYVHYDKGNVVSDEDVQTIAVMSQYFEKLYFVSNSELSEQEVKKVHSWVTETKLRKNIGYDFGAWRDCLVEIGLDELRKYDELVLLNNSFYKPVFDLSHMFCEMEQKQLDFWGVTVFPYSEDGSYIKKSCINEHLQSYFIVLNRQVFESDVFWKFWKKLPDYEDFIDVVANCETQFTKCLADAGFSYEPYIRESYYISKFLNNYSIPYEKPTSLLLLKDPLVKKKCYQYMNEEEKIKLEWLLEKLKIC